MHLNEFDQSLQLLPEPLRQRAAELRPYLSRTRCHRCREIADALELALMAARYDEVMAAEHLIGSAERLAGDHSHIPPPGRPTEHLHRPPTRRHRAAANGSPIRISRRGRPG